MAIYCYILEYLVCWIRKTHAHCMHAVTALHTIPILVITAKPWNMVWLHNQHICSPSPCFFGIAFYKCICCFQRVAYLPACLAVINLSLMLLRVIESSLLVLIIFLVPRSGLPCFYDLYYCSYAWSCFTTFTYFSFK